MKHKLLCYVVIVSAMLTSAFVTPQALAEKTRGIPVKSTISKDHNQPGQLQITGIPGSPSSTTTISGNREMHRSNALRVDAACDAPASRNAGALPDEFPRWSVGTRKIIR